MTLVAQCHVEKDELRCEILVIHSACIEHCRLLHATYQHLQSKDGFAYLRLPVVNERKKEAPDEGKKNHGPVDVRKNVEDTLTLLGTFKLGDVLSAVINSRTTLHIPHNLSQSKAELAEDRSKVQDPLKAIPHNLVLLRWKLALNQLNRLAEEAQYREF